MIESLLGVFTVGFLLGAPAGISPGPMLVLIISETFRHGIRAGAKVAFIPLLTDLPVVLVSGFLYAELSNMDFLLGAISLSGAVFLTYLGSRSIRAASAEIPDFTPRPLHLKELMVANLLNPNPYLFWFTVGAPLMVRSFQQTLEMGAAFLISFYLGLVGVKFMLAIVAGKSRSFLQGIWYRRIMQFLGLALIGFAIFLLQDGLKFFGILQQI
ncbi:MAG: LysE family transporter [SAR324 cluster bacterium]|jgi:threonine/homoserine/homoserine lactone efflux protein|nr:LysE family transporter [SAR324 cluster bacterium]MCH2265599.1 LysE family transporter [SAR324 cluster bacterium]